jgi:hypothetical protein
MNIQELVLLLKGQPIAKEGSQVVCISARSADRHKVDLLIDHIHRHVIVNSTTDGTPVESARPQYHSMLASDKRAHQKFNRKYFSGLLDQENGSVELYVKYLLDNHELTGALLISGFEYLLKYASTRDLVMLFNAWRKLLLKNVSKWLADHRSYICSNLRGSVTS